VATANTSFLSMMADAIPRDRISNVVGLRLAGLGLASTVTTLIAGRVLQWVAFPLKLPGHLLRRWLASMVSVWHSTRWSCRSIPLRRSRRRSR